MRPRSRRSRTAGARPPVSSLAGLGSLPVSGALRSQGRSKSSRISDNPGRTPTLTITFNTMTRDKSESVTLDTASGFIDRELSRDPGVTRSRPGTDVPAARRLGLGTGGPARPARPSSDSESRGPGRIPPLRFRGNHREAKLPSRTSTAQPRRPGASSLP